MRSALLLLVFFVSLKAFSQGYLYFRNEKNKFAAGSTTQCGTNSMDVFFDGKLLQTVIGEGCGYSTHSSGDINTYKPDNTSGNTSGRYKNANTFRWKITSIVNSQTFSGEGEQSVAIPENRIALVTFEAVSSVSVFNYETEFLYTTDILPKIKTPSVTNNLAIHTDSVTLEAPPFLTNNFEGDEIIWLKDGLQIEIAKNVYRKGKQLTVKYKNEENGDGCKVQRYSAKAVNYNWYSESIEIKFGPNLKLGTDILIRQPLCIFPQSGNDTSKTVGQLGFSKSLQGREFKIGTGIHGPSTLRNQDIMSIESSPKPIPIIILENLGPIPSCPQYDTLHILPPHPITLDSSRFNDINCFGGTASYTLQIGSQAAKDTVLFDNKIKYILDKDNPFTVPDIPKGSHSLKIKDQNGCVLDSTLTFTAIEPSKLEPSIVLKHPLCHSGKGTALLTPKGGTPPYQYRFEADSVYSSTRVASRSAGTRLRPSLLDANGCTAALKDTMIKVPVDFFPSAVVKTPNRCFYDSVAEALVTVKGNGKYTFSKDSLEFQSAPSIGGLPTGRQTLYVRNDSLCVKPVEVTIASLPKMIISTIHKTDATCVGDSNGSFYFQVYNGNGKKRLSSDILPPYSSKATAFNYLYENLKAQSYHFAVTDDSGCTQRVDFVIGTRSDMKQTFNTLSPTCMLSEDGEIAASTLGGVKPYSYQWIGQTSRTATQTRLKQGNYAVKVTDSLSCSRTDTVYLKANIQIPVKLQGHPYLCKGQQLELDAGAFGEAFTWTKNNKTISNKRRLTIDSGGTYTVTVKDRTGCTGSDSLQVHYVDKAIEPSFLMSTKAVVGDIVVVAVNSLGYDRVSWSDSIPNAVVQDSNSQHTKEYIFTQPGEYQVPMTMQKDKCVATVWKSIQIYPSFYKQEVEQALGIKSKLIRRVAASPNPSRGEFTLEVELEYSVDMEVSLFDIAKGSPILHRSLVGKNNYALPFAQDLSQGLYMLYVRVREETASYRVLITND